MTASLKDPQSILDAVLAVLFCADPPRASTLPVGSSTAFIWMRGADMGGRERQAAVGWDRSMSSALAVAGLSPPMIITRARYPSLARNGSKTEDP